MACGCQKSAEIKLVTLELYYFLLKYQYLALNMIAYSLTRSFAVFGKSTVEVMT